MNTLFQNTPIHPSQRLSPLHLVASLIMVAILGLILVPTTLAQSPTSTLAALDIELWPDYDRSEVLVLLTGTLTDNAPVPATVTVPIPEEASINAVAHVSLVSGNMENVEEVDSSTPGQITFTTPSPTFRIEYYMPYTVDGDQRQINFDWQSDLMIQQLSATVQQPAEATSFEISPAAAQTQTRQDGLVYHALAPQALAAGQQFSLSASYDLASGQLSASVLPTPLPTAEGPLAVTSEPAQTASPGFNWPIVAIVAGGLIIVAALVWFLFASNNRGRKRTPRPRPKRAINSRKSAGSRSSSSSATAAQFCHNCGQAVDADDRFCRECGTPLKGR